MKSIKKILISNADPSQAVQKREHHIIPEVPTAEGKHQSSITPKKV